MQGIGEFLFTLRQIITEGPLWFFMPLILIGLSIWVSVKLGEKFPYKPLKWIACGYWVILSLFILAFWFGGIYIFCATEKVAADTVFISQNRATLIKAGTFIYQDFKSTRVPYQEEKFEVSVSHQPITANPKVRDLHYSVTLCRPMNMNSIMYIQQNLGNDWINECDTQVLYWLYEYNEKNSKSLSGYYNPYSAKQQKQFQNQISNYLAPLVQKEWKGHITIDSIVFSLG